MSRMLKSSGAMALATLLSRFLGLARVMAYAHFMGGGMVSGAFTLAFMIPNLFRRLLGEGALTAAFIPLFKEKEAKEGDAAMWETANAVLSALFVAGSAVVVLAMAGLTVALLGWEFSPRVELVLRLTRIMFPYLVLVCLAAAFMAMLNARNWFFIPSLGATTLNLVMITTVLFVAPRLSGGLEDQVFALAGGVLVAGIVQAGFQYPALRREGFRLRWVSPWKNRSVKIVVERMIPGALGIAAFQINVLGSQSIAFLHSPKIVAAYDYAVRLMELPQGVFAISLSTFLLPTLAGLAARGKTDEYKDTLTRGLSHLVYINLPAGIGMMLLAEPIVRLLFERGMFTPEDTVRAGHALFWLAPGLVAFSVTNVLARAFFALGDTRTPMRISVICLTLNLILVFFLIHFTSLEAGGLGLANSITAAINALILGYGLRQRLDGLQAGRLWRSLPSVGLGTVGMSIVVWASHRWVLTSLPGKANEVVLPILAGVVTYFALTLLLKSDTPREILDLLQRRSSKVTPPDTGSPSC